MKQYLAEGRSVEFDLSRYIDDAVEYVKKERIHGVTGFHDIDMLLAAVVSERCGLPGPTPESVFLCYHKYYSRVAEKPKLWFEGIDFHNSDWKSRMRYPCFVKPVCMTDTIGGQNICNEQEMKGALEVYREKLSAVMEFYITVFDIAVDKTKYPLASTFMLIAEELIAGDDVTQHCVEGWADCDGNFHLLEIDDDLISDAKVFSSEMIPSTISEEEMRLVVAESKSLVRRTGLRSCMFIVEVFLRNIGGTPRVDTIEINNRACWYHHYQYLGLCGTSPPVISVMVAYGDDGEAKRQSDKMRQKNKRKHSILCSFHARKSGFIPELVDLDAVEYYQRTPQEHVYGAHLKPGVVLELSRTAYVRLIPEGIRLGYFVLFGNDPVELRRKGDVVRSKLVKI
jgi:hypothetical protein